MSTGNPRTPGPYLVQFSKFEVWHNLSLSEGFYNAHNTLLSLLEIEPKSIVTQKDSQDDFCARCHQQPPSRDARPVPHRHSKPLFLLTWAEVTPFPNSLCLSLISIPVIKHWPKTTWEAEDLFDFCVPSHTPLREAKAGT